MAPRRRSEWFDDTAFWRVTYPFMFPAQRFEKAPEEVRQLLRLARPPGRTALDLCCGPGRCAVALAKRGYRVTGVDKTEFLLRKARTRGRAARVNVEWVRADMRDFVRPDTYHLVLSVFTSFGYFENPADDRKVLENIHANLKPGGVLIMDMAGKELLARIFNSTTSEVLPDGSTLVQRHEVVDDWTRLRNVWTVIRRGRARSFRFTHRIFSGCELSDRLERAGFDEIRLYGNLAGGPYGLRAQRLIAVARKADARRRKDGL